MLGITNERILAGFEAARERPVTLRANTLKASAEEIAEALTQAGFSYERVPWYADAFVLPGANMRDLWQLDFYKQGKVYLQSLSSMLPPLLLKPRAGADILDMCAAPGGKTAQTAALTSNNAHLTACELHVPRAEKLAYNLEKLGVANVNIMRTDARRLDEFFSFDQILLDAPCTGTGTYCVGNEKAEKRMTEQLLAKVTKAQRALLDRGLSILKPGGTLVYSTCSVLSQENEEQVLAALKRHRDCCVVPIVLGSQTEACAEVDNSQADSSQSKGGTATSSVKQQKERRVTLPHAAEDPFAVPVLENGLPGTLTVCPTRDFEGFFCAVITKDKR